MSSYGLGLRFVPPQRRAGDHQNWRGTALGILLGGVVLLCGRCAFALNASLDITQYAHTAWKVRDGFTQGTIASIAQTPDGYIWLGTEFGLFRFDGVRTVSWQPPANRHLPPGTVRSLLVSRDGTLWIGAKGLASWKDGKFTDYPELAQTFIFALLEDHEGTVWAGGGGVPTGRMCAIHGSSVHCYGDDAGFGRFVSALYEDSQGNLWAGAKDGLWKLKPSPPKFYPLPVESDGIQALVQSPDALLVGGKGGLYRFVGGRTEVYSLGAISPQFSATKILRDRNGSLWIGTVGRGLLHVHQGKTDAFLSSDGLSGDSVLALFEDREGNIWVSTLEGLDRFRDFAVATLTTKQGLSTALVGSVLADKDGTVWLGTYGGLNRWNHGRITIPQTGGATQDGKFNGSDPNSLFQDDRGRIWVSTSRELGYLENGRFTSVKGVPAGQMLSVAQDTDGNLWVINEHVGLFRISPQNEVRRILWSSLGHDDHASVLAADPRRGGLWIGFFLGGIAYLSDGQVRLSYTPANGLGEGRVSDFRFDDDGTLWVSTEGGLSRLKNGRVTTLSSKNGLPCDPVHWAVEDNDHSLWLYTACGLVRIARSELDDWAAAVNEGRNTTRAIQVTVFDRSDGVRSLSRPGHYHPQVAKTPDGKLWFLPWDGVSVIDPHDIPLNRIPPPTHIEQIVADRKIYDVASDKNANLRLPPLIHDLEVDYTALSLVAPERIRFRYKLDGLDRDWQDVGNRRQAFYTNLPPGHYRFRVAACNNSGLWNEAGTFLDFSIASAYYQTNWFHVVSAAAFLALLWWLYQLRLQQLAREFNLRLAERVSERTRIARELHDTLLQSFHGILLQFQILSNEFQPGDTKRKLDSAIDQTARAIIEGRDAVQRLRCSTAESYDLDIAIRTLGEELATTNDSSTVTGFRLDVQGTPRKLDPILRDEVYQIAGEGVRNAFRHAEAQRIEVEIRYEERQLQVRVRDDGKGIDSKLLGKGRRDRHFGLRGMRERAELIGGKLNLWSEPDCGTEVELNIPAARAYGGQPAPAHRSWFAKKFSGKNSTLNS